MIDLTEMQQNIKSYKPEWLQKSISKQK